MKKVVLMALFALVSTFASAQSVGVHLVYGTEVDRLGLGVKGQYQFSDEIRGEASFNYFFKSNNTTYWDVNVNGHYLFPLNDKFTLYPLAGLTYCHASYDLGKASGGLISLSSSSGHLGLNAGGGADYALSDNLALNLELKLQLVKGMTQGVLNFGVAYKF